MNPKQSQSKLIADQVSAFINSGGIIVKLKHGATNEKGFVSKVSDDTRKRAAKRAGRHAKTFVNR